MFHFADLAPVFRFPAFAGRVPPFGHPRITDRLPLPGAFRRLLRPSSLSDAMASSVCPYFFTLQFIFAFY